MAIPYMGSKRASAKMIYNIIKAHNPNANTIADLFCGGFAISEEFIKAGWSVIPNDKNKYVTALIDKTINHGLDEKIVTKFVSRSEFKDVISNPQNYDNWFVGFIMCIWSFGNNQKGYLFGKDTEAIKLAGHNLVINKDQSGFIDLIPKKYIDGILKQDTWRKRRIALVKVSRALKNRSLELERLEQLERLERLEIHNENYDNVTIPEGAIIYCDPPYAGTAEYSEGGFNHPAFWNWVREISKTNKIYVSEYKAPDDFKSILTFSRKSTLQGGNQKHNNQPCECLFVPIDQEANP